MPASKSRNNSIDNVRLVAIFCIVVMHSMPFFWVAHPNAIAASIVVNQLTRFAVPCFFVISGYLFAQRVNERGLILPLRASAQRLVMLYVFWCLFYLFPFNIGQMTGGDPWSVLRPSLAVWAQWIKNPEALFLEGTKTHLWFLPALLCAMLVCAPFIVSRQYSIMLLVAASFFVAGLLAGPYVHTLIDISLPISVRNGPIFSSIFFAIGAVLTHVADTRQLVRVGGALCVAGVIGQLGELWLLAQQGPLIDPRMFPNYLVSTLALGVGPAMLAISGVAAPNNKPWLWGMGRYTLGIYALHFFVGEQFASVATRNLGSVLWSVAAPIVYFISTLILVACLSRVRVLRPLIS